MYREAFPREPGEHDAGFHALDARIDAVARAMPGCVGAQARRPAAGTRRSATCIRDTLDTLRMVTTHPAHRQAERQYARGYAGAPMLVAQVPLARGDGANAHAAPSGRHA